MFGLRGIRLVVSFGLLVAPVAARAQETLKTPRFSWPSDTVLIDEKIPIALSGLRPSSLVTIRAVGMGGRGGALAGLSSSATFLADRNGTVDLSRVMPIAGSYAVADAMGLFWSAAPPDGAPAAPRPPGVNTPVPPPMPWVLTASVDGQVVATDTVWRGAVAPAVRITRIRADSAIGVLYEPPGAGRHPAVLVLGGSTGGAAPAAGPPGGLASRGYVVFSVPYFNDEGLPPQLSNIPLEYFERALVWLRGRPSVDPSRIGVYGGSRGGELALLLGATYPTLIRAVAAFQPSSVIWNGCCDSVAIQTPSWTLRGVPLPYIGIPAGLRSQLDQLSLTTPLRQTAQFLDRLSDTALAARAAIPVEKIGGPILLVSGKDDRLWPSSVMAEQVMARLRRNHFRYAYRHLAYEDAGHMFGRPYTSTMNMNDLMHPVSHLRNDSGGTPAAQARAREESWRELLAFFDRSLRGGAVKTASLPSSP